MKKPKVYCPFSFSENLITETIYLNILELFQERQLQNDDILDPVVFQYDSTTPHFAHFVHGDPNRITSAESFQFSEPYTLQFFAWVYINSKV